MLQKNWYGIRGETLEEVENFGSKMPTNFNSDYLVFAEGPKEAFEYYYTKKCERLEKELKRAKELAGKG